MNSSAFFFSTISNVLPPLLDTYPGAVGAWSVARKLRTSYTGPCLRVSRSSDNTETDIGFAGNVLDTAALLTFVGAGHGLVVNVYDQNAANHLVQTADPTARPAIVLAGVLQTRAGKPCLTYRSILGVHDNLEFTTRITDVRSVFFVGSKVANAPMLGDTLTFGWVAGGTANYFDPVSANLAVRNGTMYRNGQLIAPTGVSPLNGQNEILSVIATGPVPASRLSRDRHISSRSHLGTVVQEVVLYNTDQLANRHGIESEINSFYQYF